MRRLLILAAILFASLEVAWAQLPWQPGVGTPVSGGGTPFTTNCTESGNFLNTKVGGQGMGMSTTIAAYYDTMICGMVTDGTWAILDTLYIEAAPTTPIAKYNLTATATTYDLVSHGGTFTANNNYQGNGSSDYLDTQFVASTASGHYTATSASFGIYIMNNLGISTTAMSMGTQDSTGNKRVFNIPFYDNVGTGSLSEVNDSAVYSAASYGGMETSGCRGAWNNGSNVGSEFVDGAGGHAGSTPATSSPAMPDFSIYLDANNNTGTASNFGAFKIGAAWIGGTMTSTDVLNMCARINTFMTSQGVNAY
jgi:hypothetical protein